jgi:hypothetical protein
MPKFRTKIAHKKGSEIEIHGHIIKMTPDEGQGDPGICTFEVPADRDDVFAAWLRFPKALSCWAMTKPSQPAPPKLPKPLNPSPIPPRW